VESCSQINKPTASFYRPDALPVKALQGSRGAFLVLTKTHGGGVVTSVSVLWQAFSFV